MIEIIEFLNGRWIQVPTHWYPNFINKASDRHCGLPWVIIIIIIIIIIVIYYLIVSFHVSHCDQKGRTEYTQKNTSTQLLSFCPCPRARNGQNVVTTQVLLYYSSIYWTHLWSRHTASSGFSAIVGVKCSRQIRVMYSSINSLHRLLNVSLIPKRQHHASLIAHKNK